MYCIGCESPTGTQAKPRRKPDLSRLGDLATVIGGIHHARSPFSMQHRHGPPAPPEETARRGFGLPSD